MCVPNMVSSMMIRQEERIRPEYTETPLIFVFQNSICKYAETWASFILNLTYISPRQRFTLPEIPEDLLSLSVHFRESNLVEDRTYNVT